MAFLHPSIPSPELSGVPRAGAPLPPRLIVHERPWPSEWQSRLSRPSWQLGHLRRGKIVSIACVLANTARCAPHTVASPERRAFPEHSNSARSPSGAFPERCAEGRQPVHPPAGGAAKPSTRRATTPTSRLCVARQQHTSGSNLSCSLHGVRSAQQSSSEAHCMQFLGWSWVVREHRK